MARPRLNRNGLWARIFGKIVEKIFGKNRREIAKVEKNCKNFWENSKKIAENSKKNSGKFQKKFRKTYENFLKPLLLPINRAQP